MHPSLRPLWGTPLTVSVHVWNFCLTGTVSLQLQGEYQNPA